MGTLVNRKPERAVQAKIRDKNKKKSVHPASWKPERAACAKRGFPVDRKPERAIQAKVRELKRMTMSRRITSKTISSSTSSRFLINPVIGKRSIGWTDIQSCEGYSGMESHGIISHSHPLFCIKSFNIYDKVLLLGWLSPLYKYTQRKSIQILLPKFVSFPFSFSLALFVLFWETSNVLLNRHMHLKHNHFLNEPKKEDYW